MTNLNCLFKPHEFSKVWNNTPEANTKIFSTFEKKFVRLHLINCKTYSNDKGQLFQKRNRKFKDIRLIFFHYFNLSR